MATPTFVTLANAAQYNSTNTGAALSNSVTLTDVSPGGSTAGQAWQTNADQLYPGMLLEFWASGIYSTSGTPTLSVGLYYGGVAGTALAATAAAATSSGVANGIWTLYALSRVVSVGTSGSIQTIGQVLGTGATPGTAVLLPATSSSGNTVSSLDTSTAKIITVGAQWGTQSNSNTITCYQFIVKYLTQP